jgi:hypothetical protein
MTIKTEKQKREVEEEIIVDIVCNVCGGSLKDRCGMNYEGLVASFTGGYAAILGDCVTYNFAICEVCLRDKIFPMFKIEPGTEDHILGEYVEEDE